jgi:hypothetical protein
MGDSMWANIGRSAVSIADAALAVSPEQPQSDGDVLADALRCSSVFEGKQCGRNSGHTERHTYFYDPSGETSWGDTPEHFTQASWNADPWLRDGEGFEAFGVGEAA